MFLTDYIEFAIFRLYVKTVASMTLNYRILYDFSHWFIITKEKDISCNRPSPCKYTLGTRSSRIVYAQVRPFPKTDEADDEDGVSGLFLLRFPVEGPHSDGDDFQLRPGNVRVIGGKLIPLSRRGCAPPPPPGAMKINRTNLHSNNRGVNVRCFFSFPIHLPSTASALVIRLHCPGIAPTGK